MENTTPDPESLFLDLLAASVNEARENVQIVSSPHESHALLQERLEAYWLAVRQRREPEILLDLLLGLATQCVAVADDLYLDQVEENASQEES